MTILDKSPINSLEEPLRKGIIAYLEDVVVTHPTVHALSLLCIRDALEHGTIDPGTALAHIDLMDFSKRTTETIN